MGYKLKVIIDGNEYPINLKNCGGCEFCELGECGWACGYDPDDPEACAWPEDVVGNNPMAQDVDLSSDDGQLPLL